MTITKQRVTCSDCRAVSDVELVVDAPISVAAASMKAARCPHCSGDNLGLGGRYDDAPPLTSSIIERAGWWRERGETGNSSLTIWSVFMLGQVEKRTIPYDPDDYQRCRQLFNLIPEWRAEIGKVSAALPWWLPFTDRWDAFDKLYAKEEPSGVCPKLYALMKIAQKESDKIRGRSC